MPTHEITNKIIKSELINWKKLLWAQGELKTLTKESFERLKQSLRNNSFIQPFNVWQDGESLQCLDGHHRQKAMQELESEGVQIPEMLPANFIDCTDIKEARKFVLIYSSIYARATDEALYEFIHKNELDFEILKQEIDLPELDIVKFETGWMKDYNPENKEKEISELTTENECPSCGYKW